MNKCIHIQCFQCMLQWRNLSCNTDQYWWWSITIVTPKSICIYWWKNCCFPQSSCNSKNLFNVYRKFRQNCFRKHRFVSGALYGFLYNHLVQIISPKKGTLIRLVVMSKSSEEKDDKLSEVKIVYDPISTRKYLVACNLLAKSLSSESGNTCCNNAHDLGKWGWLVMGQNNVMKMVFIRWPIRTQGQNMISLKSHNCVGSIIHNVAWKKR